MDATPIVLVVKICLRKINEEAKINLELSYLL